MKRIIPIVMAAALLSLTACGKTEKDTSSADDTSGMYTTEEQSDIDTAKDVISKWFGYMNKAEYSNAKELMSEDYAAALGFNEAVDGEGAWHYSCEFTDEGALLTTDEQGNMVVCVSYKMTDLDNPDKVTDQVMFVTCYDTGAVITSGGDNFGGGSTENSETDRGKLAEQLAQLAYQAAAECAETLAEEKNSPEDGSYTLEDDNEIINAAKTALGNKADGLDPQLCVTVEDGLVISADVSLTEDGITVTASYPSASQN